MGKTKEQVKGITARGESVVVIPKASNPKRQFMSKADAMKDNERLRKANQAAEEARRRVLAESGMDETEETGEAGQEGNPRLSEAKKELAEVEAKIQKKETPALLKKKQNLEDEIEQLESMEA